MQRFAAHTLAPRAADIDEHESWVGVHRGALAGMGLTGMNLPERWGGAGVSARALMLAVEAVAGACGSTASMLTAHFLASDAVLLGGNDEQRMRWLPGAADGSLLGAFALTEPGAGSSPADMRCRAIPERDGSWGASASSPMVARPISWSCLQSPTPTPATGASAPSWSNTARPGLARAARRRRWD